jgi:outer membrane protein assembly factor BamB
MRTAQELSRNPGFGGRDNDRSQLSEGKPMHRTNRRLRLAALLATAAWLGVGSAWASGPNIFLTPSENHPNSTTQVAGNGFSPYAAVDIYFDNTDEALAIANSAGKFVKIPVPVSASQLPGTHYITAVQRSNGQGAQQVFTVNTDWAQFHFNEKLRGNNAWENVLAPNNVASLDTAWTFATGNGVDSSPAVVGGNLYVGSTDDNLYSLNATTGAVNWGGPINFGCKIESSPAVANGVVYFGCDNGVLYSVNAATGVQGWSSGAGGNNVVGSPTAANGVVYVGDSLGNVFAFNATGGTLVWQYTTGGPITSAPAVANGVVYISSGDGNLYALNATTGAFLWKQPGASAPAVSNGSVYVDGGEGVVAYRAADGFQEWTASVGDGYPTSPVVANGVVYVGNQPEGLDQGLISAFNARDGEPLWSFSDGPGDGFESASVANGVVYVGDNFYGYMWALDATTGAVLWSAVGVGANTSSPAVSNGMVYVGSEGDNIYAYALNGGNDKVYKNNRKPPAIHSLHPDWSLKPYQSENTVQRAENAD